MSITFTPRKLAKYIAKLDKTTINEATGLTEYEAFALKDTLDRAHRGHTYVTDQDRYAVPDLWRADLVGDCEDFALWVRHELQCQYNIEPDLLFCNLKSHPDQYHVVVHYKGFVLDNRYPFVMPSDACKYNYIYIGTPNGLWFEVEPK